MRARRGNKPRSIWERGSGPKKPRARQLADPGLNLTCNLHLSQDNFPENVLSIDLDFAEVNPGIITGYTFNIVQFRHLWQWFV